MQEKFKTYQLPNGKKGIDDLLGVHAFIGNSQGDRSATNDIEVYKASGGWMIFLWDGIVDKEDQEAINKEVERRKQANIDYINKLVSKGEYGKEYKRGSVTLMHNPLFDEPKVEFSLSSHTIYIINKEDEGN